MQQSKADSSQSILVSSTNPTPLKRGLNPEAKAFVPSTGPSYESTYHPVHPSERIDSVSGDIDRSDLFEGQGDFGKVMCMGGSEDQILQSFGMGILERQPSEFSKDTREDRGEQDYDSEDMIDFEDHEYNEVGPAEGEGDPDGDNDEVDDLTAEEREWLESQCEAKDNPPGFFW